MASVLNEIIHHFLHLAAESVPLFLLGAAIGAAVEAWMPSGWVERWLARGKGSVVLAAVAGAVLPGCAMSTMPLAGALRARGVPVGTVAAFIMIAPILSPHTIAMTATLVSLPMAGARVVLAFVAACALGFVLNALRAAAPALSAEEKKPCCSEGEDEPPVKKASCCDSAASVSAPSAGRDGRENPSLRRWLAGFTGSLRELTPFLAVGLFVAALLMAFFPPEKIGAHLRGGWMAYTGAVLVAVPVYVCDGGEIPLTRALLELGAGPGPAFCFMLAAVGTCFATITMSGRIIGWCATSAYLLAWLVLAVGGGLLVGAWLCE